MILLLLLQPLASSCKVSQGIFDATVVIVADLRLLRAVAIAAQWRRVDNDLLNPEPIGSTPEVRVVARGALRMDLLGAVVPAASVNFSNASTHDEAWIG